jgi:hypothetical protein
MFRSLVFSLTRLAVVLPLTVLAAACGGSEAPGAIGENDSGNGGSSAGGQTSNGGTMSGGGAGGTRADGEALGPAPVRLGDAGEYAILAQSAISNVPTSVVTGDVGLSPAAASYITGLNLTRAGAKWTSPEIIGDVFSADNDPNTPTDLTIAVADMLTAYADAAGRPTPAFLNLRDGAIGGLTLTPGLYKWTSTVTIPTDVTLSGGAQDVWIFQITGDLTLAAAQQILLSGGARARNIIWQVAGEVDFGTSSHAEGIVLSRTAIHMGAGASLNGRLLAQTGVTLQSSTVTGPAP